METAFARIFGVEKPYGSCPPKFLINGRSEVQEGCHQKNHLDVWGGIYGLERSEE